MNPDAYLTRAQAVMFTGVPSSTIAHWRARGWLTPEGERRHLRTRAGERSWLEYHLGDLVDAERDTRSSRNSPRNWRRGRAEEQAAA